MTIRSADQPIAYFHMPTPEGEPTDQIVRVAEIIPDGGDESDAQFEESLTVCVNGVRQLMDESWSNKFVRNAQVLRQSEVDATIMSPHQQRRAIEQCAPGEPDRRLARYLITSVGEGFDPVTDPSHIRAVLRAESYQPRLPTPANPHRLPYPNITDIETRNGRLVGGEYGFDALALMRTVLYNARPHHKVAAYTERENPDGIAFLEGLEFKDRQRDQRQAIGPPRPGANGGAAEQAFLTYVHMEARRAGAVQLTLNRMVRRFVL